MTFGRNFYSISENLARFRELPFLLLTQITNKIEKNKGRQKKKDKKAKS